MNTTRWKWWSPATFVIGLMATTLGLLGLGVGESGDGSATVLMAIPPALGGSLILVGLAVRRNRMVGGSRVVIVGAALIATDPIFIPVAAIVILGGMWTGDLTPTENRAEVVPLAVTRRSITDGWRWWIVGSVALVALGFAVLVVWENTGLVPDDCTEVNPCWEDTMAWATWSLSWFAAAITGATGVLLGVLRVFTRHHTRAV